MKAGLGLAAALAAVVVVLLALKQLFWMAIGASAVLVIQHQDWPVLAKGLAWLQGAAARAWAFLRVLLAVSNAPRAVFVSEVLALAPIPPPRLTIARSVANVSGALVKLLRFMWTYRTPILGLAALIFLFSVCAPMLKGCALPFGESREAKAVRVDRAETNQVVAKKETAIANEAVRIIEHVHTVETRVETVVKQAETLSGETDPHALYADYERLYRLVWDDAERAPGAHPPAGNTGPMHDA